MKALVFEIKISLVTETMQRYSGTRPFFMKVKG